MSSTALGVRMNPAPSFRYRFVGYGTQFTSVDDVRPSDRPPGPENEHELFANEVATDVGGRCWGPGSDLAVIDHHFARTDHVEQFPSASAAVLHNVRRIQE